MPRIVLAVALACCLGGTAALAQRTIEPEPLPPLAPAAEPARGAAVSGATPALTTPPASEARPAPEASGPGRVFCEQTVQYRLADPAALPERYRQFVGIWSDAAWTPQLCAALIVESVQPDGTAAILYAFGPMASNTKGRGSVLRGTGIIRDGELRFQNSDGSQFAFRPLYTDLDGKLTTPQGQSYQTIFKRTY